jgi:MerR-like DNA binding protein
MEMSITTTTMLAQQIARTRNRRRRLSSPAVGFGSVEALTTPDATISSVLEVKSRPARSEPEEGVSIAEAARRTGVSAHTLRYYERAGLVVTTVDRTDGGWRRYQQEDLNWIAVCTKLRAGRGRSRSASFDHSRVPEVT